MKRSMIAVVGLVAIMFFAADVARAGSIDWKGVTWDISNGTAVINGNGSLTLTVTSGTGSGIASLHANRLTWETGTFDSVMDPWVQFSFEGHKGDILIEQETYPSPTVQAGSNWGDEFAVTRYTKPDTTRSDDNYFVWSGDIAPISHVLDLGKRTDGTVDACFDSGTWAETSSLKENVGGSWGFNDVYLRLRSGTAGDSITFNDFQYGSGHVPEPATMSLLALGGLTMLIRRRNRK